MTRDAYPDCAGCEAPCCRRMFMEDDDGWYRLADARPIYQAARADVRAVGWVRQEDGRQPMLECTAFDVTRMRCTVYETRPEHCRTYDCRTQDEHPEDWEARPHCGLARHRRMEAPRARRASG